MLDKASLQHNSNLNICDLSLAGGSLDVYKKIPEHVLGRIAVAVSLHQNWFQTCKHKLKAVIFTGLFFSTWYFSSSIT